MRLLSEYPFPSIQWRQNLLRLPNFCPFPPLLLSSARTGSAGCIGSRPVSHRHSAYHLSVTSNTAHTVGVPGLPVHGHNTPLMAPLVFIHMLPAVTHIIQHTPQRSGRACTGIHARHKYPVRGAVMFIGIRYRCLLPGDPFIIIVGRKNYGVKLSSCCLSAYSTADLIA